MSSFFLKLFGEKRLLKSVKLLPLSIKSTNPIQKCPHIIESFACILKIFAIMFLLLINLLISCGMCSVPKLPHMSQFFHLHIMLSNEFQYLNTHQD